MALTGCRVFDGIDDSLQTATPLDLSGTAVLTILLRFWWDVFTNDGKILLELTSSPTSDPGSFFIWPNWDTGSALAVGMVDGGQFNFRSIPWPTPAAWHTLGIVLDRAALPADEITIYLDGVHIPGTLVLSHDTAGTFANAVLYVMARGGVSARGAGRLADLALYGSALSAEQMQAYALGVAADRFGFPIAYWPLSGDDSPEPDLVGLHPMTVTGTTQGAPPPTTIARVVDVPAGHVTIGGNGALFTGEDVILALQSPSIQNAPVNLDGYTVQFEVRQTDRSETAILSKAATIAGTYSASRASNTQRALVTLTDTETATLTGGQVYRHSWKRQDAGAEKVLAYGFFYPERATQA